MGNLVTGFRRFMMRVGATRFGAWVILSIFTPLDRILLRISRGRIATTAFFMPSLVLTTTGAKSGQTRQTPLAYISDGDRIVLIASNGGQTRNPAWYYNLRTHPHAKVTLAGRSEQVIAYEAKGIEREELWQHAVATYPGYATYQKRAGERIIPMMVLSREV